jgi:hypothetical protein
MSDAADDDLRHLTRPVRLAEDTMRRGDGRPFGAIVVRDEASAAFNEWLARQGGPTRDVSAGQGGAR